MKQVLAFVFLAAPAFADTLTVARVMRPHDVITPADLVVALEAVPGALSDPEIAIGQEVKQTVYPGRPLFEANLAPPAVIDRNDLCTLAFTKGGLEIRSDGRSLDRGAEGEKIRVMNLQSRMIVSGIINKNGIVEVSP